MALVAVVLVALSSTVPVRHERLQMQREREAELLFAGRQYREALARYADETPAGAPRQPERIEQLLLDDRFPQPRRHLRRLYVDPFTGRTDWTLIRAQGRIVGVASRGREVPRKRSGFDPGEDAFAEASSVADWRFMAAAVSAGPLQAPAAAGVSPDGGAGPPVAAEPSPGSAAPAAPAPQPLPAHDRSGCLPAYAGELQACDRLVLDQRGGCREQARLAWSRCLRGG